MIHELKTDPIPYDDVEAREKKFEIRRNDRGFAKGDTLILKKTQYSGAAMKAESAPLIYTGHEQEVTVTHLLAGGIYGLDPEWVIMSIEHPTIHEHMEDDPAYQAHLCQLAESCTCCPECSDVPCGGCQAGGLCDNYCRCDDERD